jgi:hypothetical protein
MLTQHTLNFFYHIESGIDLEAPAHEVEVDVNVQSAFQLVLIRFYVKFLEHKKKK